MAKHNYREAVDVLREQIGNRWQGPQDEGRAAMAGALRSRGYRDADDVVEALIREGHLRYRLLSEQSEASAERPNETEPVAVPVAVAPTPSSGIAGIPGVPTDTDKNFGIGYWEIGREDERILGVREGQVPPPS